MSNHDTTPSHDSHDSQSQKTTRKLNLLQINALPLSALLLAWGAVTPANSFNSLNAFISNWLTLPVLLLAFILFVMPYLGLVLEHKILCGLSLIGSLTIIMLYLNMGVK